MRKPDVLKAASDDSNTSLLPYIPLSITIPNHDGPGGQTFVESLEQRWYDPAHLVEERL